MRTEPYRRRVRGVVGHTTVVDTTDSLMLFEEGHLPVLYFPPDAVAAELLRRSDKHTTCPRKGEASYWDLVVGDRVVPDAVWSYEDPIDGRDDIKGYLAFYWGKVDRWYEEDDEVFVHVRDPYHRVDVLNSSRQVRIERDGVVLAESTGPRFLFETSLPMRTYLPLADVRQELFEPQRHDEPVPVQGRGVVPLLPGRRRRRRRPRLDLPVPDPRAAEGRGPRRVLRRARRRLPRRRAPALSRDPLVQAPLTSGQPGAETARRRTGAHEIRYDAIVVRTVASASSPAVVAHSASIRRQRSRERVRPWRPLAVSSRKRLRRSAGLGRRRT